MKKNTALILIIVSIFAVMLTSCSGGKTADENPPQSSANPSENINQSTELNYTDFIGKRIGVILGTTSERLVEVEMEGTAVQYTDHASGIEDLRKGRIDGYITDASALKVIAAAPGNESFVCVDVPAEIFSMPMGAISMDANIIARFNTFLAAAIADGTVAEMQDRWLDAVPDLDSPMPVIPLNPQNGTLKVATTGLNVPFSYVGSNSELKGYGVELAIRFAAHENMNIEFETMEFSSLIPHTVSGKADLAIANISITDERKQSVLFTDAIYDDTVAILAPNPNAQVAQVTQYRAYTDFSGKRVGGLTGSVCDVVTVEQLDAIPAYYSEDSAGIEDVRKGRIDGYMVDLSSGEVFVSMAGNEDVEIIEIPADVFAMPTGAISMNADIITRFDAFLETAKSDGTLDEMQNRWLEIGLDLNMPMPDIPSTGENGVLKVATTATLMPFSYIGDGGEFKGYSIELARRFAAYENMSIEFADMDFAGVIPYIIAGKADLGISNISITDERKQSVLFSESVFDDQLGILVLKQGGITPDTVDYLAFAGESIGMRTGTVFDGIIEHIGGEPAFYSDVSSGIEDVRKSRVGGFMADLSSMRVLVGMAGNEDLICVEIPGEIFSAPMGAISLNDSIISRFNEFLEIVKADGTLDDMQNRWLNIVPDLDSPMPDIPLVNTNGTLKVATSAGSMPFAYMGANNELKGYSIELARRFAAFENMDIEFAEMEFAGMIPYIIGGRADFAIADISITEERAKSVNFTDPIYIDKAGIVALKSSTTGEIITAGTGGGGIIEWLKTGVERNLITDNRWKMIVDGLGVTLEISLLAQILGTILGFAVCFVLTRKNKFVKWLGNLYCGLIHGTPIVVLLMISYYIIFGSVNISGVMVAVAAFSFITAASVAGNLKGAIDTIDPVEIEAARSIGFSATRAFMTVTLPQAVRRALPSYTTGFVELVKATAIVGYIAIQDLTRAGDIIRSRTYDAYFPLLFIAVIYLIVTTVCIQLFKFCIRKFSGGGEQK
ncbi:MAG: ABC transporter permease subunit [Oscillospiraceae bacterium]|nr:ABC transporter permease subunit [Oscillospiraceae bacterium]